MTNLKPLSEYLKLYSPLSEAAADELSRLPYRIRTFAPRSNLVSERSSLTEIFVVLEGVLARTQHSRGVEHVISLHGRGEAANLASVFAKVNDCGVSTCREDTRVAVVPAATLLTLVERNAEIARALWQITLRDGGATRKMMTAIATLPAVNRVAYFIGLQFGRLAGFGRDKTKYPFPLYQTQIGESLGLSLVTTNRSIKVLAEQKLLATSRHELYVNDVEGLIDFATDGADTLESAIGW